MQILPGLRNVPSILLGRVGRYDPDGPLSDAEEAGVRQDETFNSASVIKIPVLVMAYQMADRGTLSLDERIPIRKEDVRGGSGFRPRPVRRCRAATAGTRPSRRDSR